MDAGKYYALLRFEEASLAMQAAFKLGIIEKVGDRRLTVAQFQEEFGFTNQATRTFVALLDVMEILHRERGHVSVAERAGECLAIDLPTSRRPYLAMGGDDQVDSLIALLRGETSDDSMPLYGSEEVAETLMDSPEIGRAIAVGLASRARNFAEPLAAAMQAKSATPRILADIGAGSPYVAAACLGAMPTLTKAVLVDRANAMQFAREMTNDMVRGATNGRASQAEAIADKIEYCEIDFFQSVPAADAYCISNTAHDWLPEEYTTIITNVRDSIAEGGLVCIHEPLLSTMWNSAEQWVHALWMACYALTLFRLTEGKGTCYSRIEHDSIMFENGFSSAGEPVETSDGCTALFYRLGGAREESAAAEATAVQPMTA